MWASYTSILNENVNSSSTWIESKRRGVEDHAQGRQGHRWEARWTKTLAECNSQAASAEAGKTCPFLSDLLLWFYNSFLSLLPIFLLQILRNRWPMHCEMKNKNKKPYHSLSSAPKPRKGLRSSCSPATRRASACCGRAVPDPCWKSQEPGEGSGTSTKTDSLEEAGWEFEESQPKGKAKAERYI